MSTLLDEAPAARTDPLETLVAQLREVRLAWREAHGRAREPAARSCRRPTPWPMCWKTWAACCSRCAWARPSCGRDGGPHVRQTLRQTLLFLEGLMRLELQHDARLRGQELTEGPGIAELAHGRTSPPPCPWCGPNWTPTWPPRSRTSGVRSHGRAAAVAPGHAGAAGAPPGPPLHQAGLPLLARMAAELARCRTGIDIHPAPAWAPAALRAPPGW
jgi:hypothetical protein